MADYDLIVRGAHVIDAALGIDEAADIAVTGGKIAAVGRLEGARAGQEVDGRGAFASAGWIDLHVHCFHGVRSNSLHPDNDVGVHHGVTTVVDTGSFGASDFAQFRAVAESAVTRVLGYLNVAARPNMPARTGPTHGDWAQFDQKATILTAEQNRDIILGIKVLASQRHCGNLGIIPMQLARQAADEAETGLMAHIGVAPPTIQEVLNLMRPGDVITHCFKGFPGGIMNRKGRPVPEAWAAADRGVYFDIGHGQGSFCFTACHQALDSGFPFHSISTDLHTGNINGPVWTLGHTMAKFVHLGFSLAKVVELVTLGPARIMRREQEFGTLRTGACADITLFRTKEGPITYRDSEGGTEEGNIDIEAVATIREGKLVMESGNRGGFNRG